MANEFDMQLAEFGRRLLELKAARDVQGLQKIVEDMDEYRASGKGIRPEQYRVLHVILNQLHILNGQISLACTVQ